MGEFRKSFDKERSSPCIKIYCHRILLFLKFFPVAEKDIIWFEEVLEALSALKKRKLKEKEIKNFGDYNANTKFLKEEYEKIIKRTIGKWRFSEGNSDYNLCPTYSQVLLVPESISDTVLHHASRFRVQNRLPLLSNIYNGFSLMRSGQPLVGLTQKRCIQDEKLIEAIKANCTCTNAPKPISKLLIVDARPSTAAFANILIGAGVERLECYEGSERVYLNLENIHSIRESHDRLSNQIKILSQATKCGRAASALWIEIEEGCGWLDHLKGILEGVKKIVEVIGKSHVLIHCSDGWDRTSQLISLTQLCLFPEYRSKKGFKKLILKDWLASGHRFCDRNNHHFKPSINSNVFIKKQSPWNSFKNFFQDNTNTINEIFNTNTNYHNNNDNNNDINYKKDHLENENSNSSDEECPIFLQFIEATIQLCRQFPLNFPELTDEFLLEIVDAANKGGRESEDERANYNEDENGNEFFGNCEADRNKQLNINEETNNVDEEELNIEEPGVDHVIIPQVERSKMILWPAYYKRYFV